MPDINITVAHKVAVSDTQSIVCDNSDYTVHWTLDEDWSAYDTKTMRTIYMDGTFTDKVFSGAEVELPVCTVPGVVQIGLFAGDIRTSRVAIMRALPSARSAAGAPADPTPDVYDQLMEIIKGLGGVDPDDIAKAVADYLAAHPIEETDPTVPEWAKAEITDATVGQIAKITAVDAASGVPTAWEPVDMPTGGETWEKIAEIELRTDTAAYVLADFATWRKAQVIMTRPKFIRDLSKIVWCRVSAQDNLMSGYSCGYLTVGYGYIYWSFEAEVDNLRIVSSHVENNNTNANIQFLTTRTLTPLPSAPSEYKFVLLFTDTSVIQEGDKVTVIGVKR